MDINSNCKYCLIVLYSIWIWGIEFFFFIIYFDVFNFERVLINIVFNVFKNGLFLCLVWGVIFLFYVSYLLLYNKFKI